MKTNDRDVIVMSMKNNDDSWFESENHSRSVSKNDDDHEFDRSDNCRSACLSDAFSFKSNDDLQIVSLKVVQFLKKNAQVLQRIVLFLMNNKRVSKTLYNLVLKIEELRLKKEIENVDETTKIRKKLVESLMRLHAKSFEFATSIVSRIAILVNVTKKDQNLFRDFEVIEFFFAINVDVIRSIIENAINDENNIMLRNKIVIDIDEQTILNFQQSIEKCEIFVFFFVNLFENDNLLNFLSSLLNSLMMIKSMSWIKNKLTKMFSRRKMSKTTKKKFFFFDFNQLFYLFCFFVENRKSIQLFLQLHWAHSLQNEQFSKLINVVSSMCCFCSKTIVVFHCCFILVFIQLFI